MCDSGYTLTNNSCELITNQNTDILNCQYPTGDVCKSCGNG